MKIHWTILQLSAPLNFLRINHGEVKSRKLIYDLYIPLFVSLLITIGVIATDSFDSILKDQGVYESIASLLNLLSAFFIAALAAIATFQNSEVDLQMKAKGDSNRTYITGFDEHGDVKKHFLTRRQYLCYLFGYLAFITICFLIVVMIFKGVNQTISKYVFEHAIFVGSCIFVFLFYFVLVQITLLTLLGLSFLTEKVNGPF